MRVCSMVPLPQLANLLMYNIGDVKLFGTCACVPHDANAHEFPEQYFAKFGEKNGVAFV